MARSLSDLQKSISAFEGLTDGCVDQSFKRISSLKLHIADLKDTVSRSRQLGVETHRLIEGHPTGATNVLERYGLTRTQHHSAHETLRLRDHPLLDSLWPPVWTERYASSKLTGEIGTLTHLGDTGRATLYLYITHESLPYWGALEIKDSAFRSALYELLREHKGHTISEIGDLDTAHTSMR
jgi:hypothetical protein